MAGTPARQRRREKVKSPSPARPQTRTSPADVIPEHTLCRATQVDANEVTHQCFVLDDHEIHRCSNACRYHWRDGQRGGKPPRGKDGQYTDD
jgi:hypothetical protein